MATRIIGDIPKTNGKAADNAVADTGIENVEKNALNELGQKIFLDRYAVKDAKKRTLGVGDLVIVCVDDKTGQREIGTIVAMDEQAAGGAGRVKVELKDGLVVERLIEHIAKPIETSPEQMMERVARGIAAIEGANADEWYAKFRWLLNGWKFVPAGRILTAAGTDQQLTFYNCMPPEQEVLTAAGYKPIAEIQVGDLVVTHRNRLRPVLHKFERETVEPLYIFKPKKLGYDELRVTGEHKVLAIKSAWVNRHKSRDGLRLEQEAQWIPAKELQPGDYLAAAYDGEQEQVSAIRLSELLSGYQVADGKLFKPQQRSDHHGYLQEGGTKYAVNERLVVDRDLCYLFGRWLGDGCVTHRSKSDIPSGIKIVFALDEREEAERLARIIEEKFGVPASIKLSSTERWLDLWANSLPLGQFFKAFFGCYSYGKSIPAQLTRLPNELSLELLKGLFTADGYVSGNKLGILLANRRLTTQVHQLLMRLGYFFSIKENTHRLGRRPAYRLQATANECGALFQDFFGKPAPQHDMDLKYYFEHDGLRWVRIGEIAVEEYSGVVMDMEVEEDHSFVSAGVVVSNCYVIPSPKDSRRGIVDTLSQMMEIMSRGGGVGINVSSLRPRHSYVRGVNGRSSGSVSWGALYSFVTGLIEQGGSRRGALMLILNCWHPDIFEFINAKRDMGKINNANVSVGVTDKFMEAVHADADWDLLFADASDPDYETFWDGNLDKWLAAGKKTITYKTVKAREIWDAIIESAWASAEPGVFFIERANKDSNSWYYDEGYLGCTNPCVTGDTLVSTPAGWRRADSIAEGETIATVLGRGEVETVERHESVPVFRVTLSDGASLRVTAAHQFHAIRHEERTGNNANKQFTPMRLDHLKVGDMLRIAPALMPDNEVPDKPAMWRDREYGFFLGVLLGDGCYTEDKLARNTVMISCDARETEWAEIVLAMMTRAGAPAVNRYQNCDAKGRLTHSLSLAAQAQHGLAAFVSKTLLAPAISIDKEIPLAYLNTNREFLAGLLDGLWSTDGNVNLKSSHPLLRFKTASQQLAQAVRRILLMFGIHGRITTGRRGDHEIDGRAIANAHPYYEVIVSGAGVKTFAEQIGITHPDKAEKLQRAQLEFALTGNTWLARIVAIEAAGEEAVYDLYEPQSDTWITDGVVNRGCGEQPLPGFGVCNLGAINLSKFVKNGGVLWEDLGKAVRYSVRFLDNVIDATPYFFDENFRQQNSERRVGLNTMGLAEMLIRLGVRYGSEDSTRFIDKLYRFIASNAYQASADIAAEKGSFPMFDADKFLQSGYMQRMPEEIRHVVREKGMRNVTLLTQAPNGCVTPDTLVFADGALRPIATLGDPEGEQWQDISLTTHSDSGAKAVNKFYVNGYKEVVEVSTARGFHLAATLQHRVRVLDAEGNYDWKEMGALQPGDTLVMARGGLGKAEMPALDGVSLKRRRSTVQLPERMTTELAEILGFYIGDGYLKDRRGLSVAVDARDHDVVGRLQELFGKVFTLDARVEDTERNCLLVWASSYFIPRWMRANELAKANAFDAHIPEAVLAGGAASTAAFLRGLFESDGSISNGVVTFVSASQRLAKEVQIALLGLGILSTRRSLEPDEGRYGTSLRHEVRLLNSAEVLRFRERVGFVSKRKQSLLESCEDRGSRADSIPATLLQKLYTESAGLATGVRQEIASALRCGMTQERWRSLASAHKELSRLPSAHLLDGSLFFDTVADIHLGESFTFDLSVPDTNTYVANGVVAHNTIGTMVGTSTGIEPFYFWSYYRTSRLGSHEERVKVLEEWQRAHPDVDSSKEALPDYFVTAMDLAPEEHVKVQAAIQRWVDSSISKTCNLPNSYTVEQTKEIYELLYESGCKGGTIYRDGSRDVQVLNLKDKDKQASDKASSEPAKTASEEAVKKTPPPVKAEAAATTSETAVAAPQASAPTTRPTSAPAPAKAEVAATGEGAKPKIRPRPYKRRGYTVSKATPSGTAHITMNEDEEQQPFEVFVEIGKAGSDIKAMAEAMGRLMSLVLRIESPVSPTERVKEIVKQITGIGGARSYGFGKRRVLSLPDAVGQALAENYLGLATGTEEDGQGSVMGVEMPVLEEAKGKAAKALASSMEAAAADLCPSCGDSAFVRIEGCHSCFACGYSEC